MISPKVSGIGGIAQHVSKLIERLRDSGYYVDVISIENSPHIPVKGLYNPSFGISSSFISMAKRLGGMEYDVVHGHNPPSLISLKIARAKAKILTLHGLYSEQVSLLHGKHLGYISRLLGEYVLRGLDVVTCVSKEATKYYESIGANVVYIPNAIDTRDMPTEGIRLYDPQVIFMGRLSREKGVDILLLAMKYIDPGINVIILGSGPLEALVSRAAEKYQNLHYLSYRPRQEALKYLAGSDMLVLPSRFEATPTVVLEAMALKVLVVASRIPGVLDAADDSSAILVPPNNPSELAKVINKYAYNPPKELISKSYNKIINILNWDVVFRKYLDLYRSISGYTGSR